MPKQHAIAFGFVAAIATGILIGVRLSGGSAMNDERQGGAIAGRQSSATPVPIYFSTASTPSPGPPPICRV